MNDNEDPTILFAGSLDALGSTESICQDGENDVSVTQSSDLQQTRNVESDTITHDVETSRISSGVSTESTVTFNPRSRPSMWI